ncbi:MAG: choice-of-anchor Q domain-containing protein, partial [Planctomycetota bacterium]
GSVITGNSSISNGGAIYNRGSLTVISSELSHNRADEGGGIYNQMGQVIVEDSQVSQNRALDGGGGLHNGNENPINRMDVQNSTISGNEARDGGGFRDRSGGQSTILHSRFTDNSAGSGGGISVSGYSYILDDYGYYCLGHTRTSLTIEDTMITENSAIAGAFVGWGGGVSSFGADLEILRSTISGNEAVNGGGISWAGSGPFCGDGSLLVESSTISHNNAQRYGGGFDIYEGYGEGTIRRSTISYNVADANNDGAGSGGGFHARIIRGVRWDSSIIAGNIDNSGQAPDFRAIYPSLFGLSIANSLVGDSRGSGLEEFNSGVNGNIIGGPVGGAISPRLGPLADNGGPTLTHGLLLGSPAIDAGLSTVSESFDQRGEPFGRVVNGASDIGAFEVQDTIPEDFNGDFLLDCADVDALTSHIAFGPSDLVYDLTGDGLVIVSDLSHWLEVAGQVNLGRSYQIGDANLDGNVDVGDFNLWNAHKFTTTGLWCSGDFNADGVTDVSDFALWNSMRFSTPGMTPGGLQNIDERDGGQSESLWTSLSDDAVSHESVDVALSLANPESEPFYDRLVIRRLVDDGIWAIRSKFRTELCCIVDVSVGNSLVSAASASIAIELAENSV